MTRAPIRLSSMPEHTTDTHLQAHAARLRALEGERASRRSQATSDGFDGLREISQAWHENRSTAYLFRKSWADPVARWFFIIGLAIIAAVWVYLLSQ